MKKAFSSLCLLLVFSLLLSPLCYAGENADTLAIGTMLEDVVAKAEFLPASDDSEDNLPTASAYLYCIQGGMPKYWLDLSGLASDDVLLHCWFRSSDPTFYQSYYVLDLKSAEISGDNVVFHKVTDPYGFDRSDWFKTLRFHMEGAKISSMGYSSSRPSSIHQMSTSLDSQENMAKPPSGPTRLRPGPMLEMQATTPVKLVWRSKPSKDTTNTDWKVSMIYSAKNIRVLGTVSSSTTRPSSRTRLISLGRSMLFKSQTQDRTRIMIRETLMPPPVEPAQAPMNMISTSRAREYWGQRSKSLVA